MNPGIQVIVGLLLVVFGALIAAALTCLVAAAWLLDIRLLMTSLALAVSAVVVAGVMAGVGTVGEKP